jgi:hypothetical protein
MSKTYILKKDIQYPGSLAKAGTRSVMDGDFFCFPYEGNNKSPYTGWLGCAFMIMNPEAHPEWFEEVKDEFTAVLGPSFADDALLIKFSRPLSDDEKLIFQNTINKFAKRINRHRIQQSANKKFVSGIDLLDLREINKDIWKFKP